MSYTKSLIGDITEKGVYNPNTRKLQDVATIVDANFTSIESTLSDIAVEATADIIGAMFTGNTETGVTVTYQDADNTIDVVLGDHAHAGVAGDGGTLAGYQADLTSTSTLADIGVPTPNPAWSGILSGLTTASTIAQLLAAIDSHTHG